MTQADRAIKSECLEKIDAAWDKLQAFLSALSEAQMLELRDSAGWNVVDHIAHLAAWEQSVLQLFAGQPRYQALGVELALYESADIDAINAAARASWSGLSRTQALDKFQAIHEKMLSALGGLSEDEFNQPLATLFPQAARGDERRLAYVVMGNTDYHYLEHMGWMQDWVK